MAKQIYPCLWFDGNAKEAATFYGTVFEQAKITVDTPMVVNFELEGQKFMGLNGGPHFKFNPSISFMVTCSTDTEIQTIWDKLMDGGSAMMDLGKYPWSENYGWLTDRFGLSWQIMKRELAEGAQKITPCFLFTGPQYGNGEACIQQYISIFPDASITHIQLYGENAPQPEGKLMHGQFNILHATFMAMDGMGNHNFQFNEAISFVVGCEDQQEIDFFWDKLTEGGEPGRCGWLKDRFGISWQVVPNILGELMTDPEKAPAITKAFMQMNKFDIATLLKA